MSLTIDYFGLFCNPPKDLSGINETYLLRNGTVIEVKNGCKRILNTPDKFLFFDTCNKKVFCVNKNICRIKPYKADCDEGCDVTCSEKCDNDNCNDSYKYSCNDSCDVVREIEEEEWKTGIPPAPKNKLRRGSESQCYNECKNIYRNTTITEQKKIRIKLESSSINITKCSDVNFDTSCIKGCSVSLNVSRIKQGESITLVYTYSKCGKKYTVYHVINRLLTC